jgi:hypothetical protein
MSKKKLGFTSYGQKDSDIYYRKVGGSYLFVYNPIAKTLLGFMGFILIIGAYTFLSIGGVVLGIRAIFNSPFQWITMIVGWLLLGVGLRVFYNLLSVGWSKISYATRLLLLNNQSLIVIRLLPIPWIQRIQRHQVEEVKLYHDQNVWFYEEDKPVYRLGVQLKDKETEKLLNFMTFGTAPQAELKDILSRNRQIEYLELSHPDIDSLYVRRLDDRLLWMTKDVSKSWLTIFLLVLGNLTLAVGIYFLDYTALGFLGAMSLLMVSFCFQLFYELQQVWNTDRVVITPLFIQTSKMRLPFYKNYQVKKQDIALISITTIDEYKYTITIVSDGGTIHELPILFENEEQAAKQVREMQKVLQLK